ncbi:hypothetical protein KQI61_15495 [Anaerocolumna aminovalerica]|uniref:hypothetical protein n=1 Tax=Anaerocolumna aminovalerica TaxID=1527 RepID=UPI001C0EF860|nr:hypothetical protein [Anaerocolumna aminovalerica]MBU5333603.1 hypothetical protein [Anaerocolumna aminovalerica]
MFKIIKNFINEIVSMDKSIDDITESMQKARKRRLDCMLKGVDNILDFFKCST